MTTDVHLIGSRKASAENVQNVIRMIEDVRVSTRA